MMLRTRWTEEEDTIALDVTLPIEERADRVGRTVCAVKTRIGAIASSSNPVHIAAVTERWGKQRPTDIAREIGVSAELVYRIANRQKLGPSGFGTGTSEGAKAAVESSSKRPPTPKGYTAADLAWAMEHNGEHPEAGLMLAHHRDFEHWQNTRDVNRNRRRRA